MFRYEGDHLGAPGEAKPPRGVLGTACGGNFYAAVDDASVWFHRPLDGACLFLS